MRDQLAGQQHNEKAGARDHGDGVDVPMAEPQGQGRQGHRGDADIGDEVLPQRHLVRPLFLPALWPERSQRDQRISVDGTCSKQVAEPGQVARRGQESDCAVRDGDDRKAAHHEHQAPALGRQAAANADEDHRDDRDVRQRKCRAHPRREG